MLSLLVRLFNFTKCDSRNCADCVHLFDQKERHLRIRWILKQNRQILGRDWVNLCQPSAKNILGLIDLDDLAINQKKRGKSKDWPVHPALYRYSVDVFRDLVWHLLGLPVPN